MTQKSPATRSDSNPEYAFDDLHTISEEFHDLVDELKDEANAAEDKEKAETLHYYTGEFLETVNDLDAWIATYEGAVNEKLKNNRLMYERDTYQMLVRIFQWDKADVRVLAHLIRDLKELTAHLGIEVPYVIDLKQLPSEDIPADIAIYPVFALDRQGYCLCGLGLDTVRYIDEIREEMGK